MEVSYIGIQLRRAKALLFFIIGQLCSNRKDQNLYNIGKEKILKLTKSLESEVKKRWLYLRY